MYFYLSSIISLFLFCTIDAAIIPTRKSTGNFVEGSLFAGRLGNQFFEIATALSYGIDHNIPAYFPDLQTKKTEGVPVYAQHVFFRLNQSKPPRPAYIFYDRPDFTYAPIPSHTKIKLVGYFQSERYFQKNWSLIKEYFKPSDEIWNYLYGKYAEIIDHPNTVGIHIRDYIAENTCNAKVFWSLSPSYFENAISFFGNDSLFVVFSDNIPRAREVLANVHRPIIFIENERDFHDLYLMSFMKHQIISNSTFSWWAAYLNDNPDKVVIAPKKWFNPSYPAKSDNIIPKSWICID